MVAKYLLFIAFFDRCRSDSDSLVIGRINDVLEAGQLVLVATIVDVGLIDGLGLLIRHNL